MFAALIETVRWAVRGKRRGELNPELANPVDMSAVHLFLSSGPVVKGVMIILALASLVSWAIIIQKVFRYRGLARDMEAFEQQFWSGQAIEAPYGTLKGGKLRGPPSL